MHAADELGGEPDYTLIPFDDAIGRAMLDGATSCLVRGKHLHDLGASVSALATGASGGLPPPATVCLMSSTGISRLIRAPRAAVYRALIDADAIAKWRVPEGMTSVVHEFDAREGGSFRVSLTYDEPTRTGKTAAHTDTYRGRFARLVPNEWVVEVLEFETADPTLRGEMTITTTLADADGGTEVVIEHEGLPRGVSPADNELGTRMSLDHLAALVESR